MGSFPEIFSKHWDRNGNHSYIYIYAYIFMAYSYNFICIYIYTYIYNMHIFMGFLYIVMASEHFRAQLLVFSTWESWGSKWWYSNNPPVNVYIERWEQSPLWIGKSTISERAIFNSYVTLPEGMVYDTCNYS